MGPDLQKMSDDELFKRLGLVNSRLSWAATSSHCGKLLAQLQGMNQEILMVIQERAERQAMKARLELMPDVVNIEEAKKVTRTDDSNSRAKSKSDIIGRLRRTTAPSNIKE